MDNQKETTTAVKKSETDLAAEVAALRGELEALAGTVGRIGNAGLSSARAAANDGLSRGKALGSELRDEIRRDLERAGGRIRTETQERPWQALGAAALAGFVLAVFMRR